MAAMFVTVLWTKTKKQKKKPLKLKPVLQDVMKHSLRGIHRLQLSLSDWQNKLLNPLLRPHVTKHTCYSNNGCSAYHKYHSGTRWDQWTYKSGWKTINPSVVENSSIILAWDCCVIPLSESHITSKQKGIMEDNLNMSNRNMSLFNI